MKQKHTIGVLMALFLLAGSVEMDSQNKVLYPYNMNPTEHPDYLRHHVKAPDLSLFDNKTQFIGLRDLSGDDYKDKITRWVDKNKLGNILWVSYPLIYQENLKEVVAEIKKRNLFLFDLWGYIPGSGPGGYWQQFVIPDGVLDLFKNELGEHWLGMDNGEQDGRYVGSFAPRMYPMGSDRKQQYFNFQRHFQEMGDQLGNKLATLVSLNFGHYFIKEGIYTLIGAETAQGLPNSQIYYSFIRGAGKQYGVHWFGNASVWNRWGWKNYDKKTINDDDKNYGAGSPLKGTSLSLLKRLIYTHLFYDCVAVGFEGSMETDENELSPIGKIQQEAVRWSEKYQDPGTMYTPVAFMTDFLSGWSFPRHLYSSNAYKVWGNLPYEKSDYLTDNMLNIIYPGYQDASYYHDERGFITPTPFGDMADCLMSDAPLWILRQYPLLVIADELQSNLETKDKLEQYVQQGGHLVITSGSLKNMKDGLLGIKVKGCREMNASVDYGSKSVQENDSFVLSELVMPADAEIIQKCQDIPAIIEYRNGKGVITVIASPFAVSEHPQCTLPVRIEEDKPLDKPYPMLKHVQAYMENLFSDYTLFETNPDLSLVTCVKNKNEYSVLVTNSSWEARPFNISSKIGEIESIKEMKINQDEIKAIGYTPKFTETDPGKNTSSQIAGGGTRAYSIKIKNPKVTISPEISSTPNVTGRALTLRNIHNLKEEILIRPTFFEHYDRVVIDWRYIEDKDRESLSAESGWLKRQKLKMTVDLTSGLNLYPDLRIVNNHPEFYQKSMNRMKQIIDKMQILGADELIISSQRSIENNFTAKEFYKSLIESFQTLTDYAKERNISLLYRPSHMRVGFKVTDAIQIVKDVSRGNFSLAPSVALLLDDKEHLDQNISALKENGVKNLIWAAPQRDIHNQIWNMNCPISQYPDQNVVSKILESFPESNHIMDGLYQSWDDEYLDSKILTRHSL